MAAITKHKNAYISKTVRDRAILTKLLIHRISLQSSRPNFQKNFLSRNMAAILNFFAKIAKHKNSYILKTVRDREILTKFLTHRVSLQSSHSNCQKIFVSSKRAAILNFPQKSQNTKMLVSRKPCKMERFRRNL